MQRLANTAEGVSNADGAGPSRSGDDVTNVNEKPQFIGPPKILDKRNQEIIRISCQYLKDIKLDQVADLLMRESGCRMDHPLVDQFRQHVMDGNWDGVDNVFNELKILVNNQHQSLVEMRFLLLEQKYLELLDDGLTLEALQVLRDELTPLNHNTERVHVLSGFIMCSRDDLQARAKWNGKGTASRTALMDKLQRYLSPEIMLPPKRLQTLFSQALKMQMQKCIYHVASNPATLQTKCLLVDHSCGKDHFPCHTTQVLNDHRDEVWYCKFSPDGLKLATGSKDTTVIIWDVNPETLTVTHRINLSSDIMVAFIAWSADSNKLIACGSEDCPEVWIWNIDNPACKSHGTTYSYNTNTSLTACAWHRDSTKFVTGGIRGQFYECDMDGNRLNSWHGVRIRCLWWKSDGQTVLAADSQYRIRSYNFNDHTDFTILQETHPIMSFSLNSTERLALLNLATQGIHLWDLENRCLVRRFRGLAQGYLTIYSSFGGLNEDFIASGSEDGKVYIWHINQESPIATLAGHNETINSVSWNPVYHRMIASVSDDCSVRIWGPRLKSSDGSNNAHIDD